MTTSVFIARLLGPFFLALGVALLFNGAIYRAMAEEFLASYALIFLTGIVTLPAGLAIVLTHNVWTTDWPVIITILGWLTVFAGALRLIAPRQAVAMGRAMFTPAAATIGGVIWLAIGALLCFFGYFR